MHGATNVELSYRSLSDCSQELESNYTPCPSACALQVFKILAGILWLSQIGFCGCVFIVRSKSLCVTLCLPEVWRLNSGCKTVHSAQRHALPLTEDNNSKSGTKYEKENREN